MIATDQSAALERAGRLAPLAVYLHWPFCLSKCPYCDFNSHVRDSVDDGQWQTAFLRQIDAYAARVGRREVGSIFFGGGTPSLMPPALAASVIDRIAQHWPVAPDVEITLEANPSAVDRARFEGFAAAGINRVSIGVQSFDDKDLAFLGRGHSASDATAAINLAQRYFGRSSFDLIYALPNQTRSAWAEALNEAMARAAGHLSLYQLTIEPGTAFHTVWERGDLNIPDDDSAGALYEQTQEITAAAGMPAYEISNHARPGDESRHNLTYWRYGDYLGIGPGAHGRLTVDGVRHATRHHRAPEIWLQRALDETAASDAPEPAATEQGSYVVNGQDSATEALMMGLRTREGVPAGRLAQLAGGAGSILDPAKIAQMVEAGFLEDREDVIRATPAGRQRLNALLAAILR